MHVVIVDEELPYPPTSGKRLRILGLVRHLAGRHRMTFVCHRNADAEEAREAARYFASCGIEVLLVDRQSNPWREGGLARILRACYLNPSQPHFAGPFSKLRFPARLALNLFSPVPYSVQWNNCPRLREAVRKYHSTHSADVWQCEWAPYATTFLGTDGIRWAMMAHDIQSFAWERYYRNETNPLKRWYVKKQWEKYRRYESRVFSEAPMTITVSEEDERRALAMRGGCRDDASRKDFFPRLTAVVDNGVDVAHYQELAGAAGHGVPTEWVGSGSARAEWSACGSQPARGTRLRVTTDILFLGNLEFRPNLDAVRLLLDQVFPAVRAAEPSARLCIVGRRPPAWLRRRGQENANIEVHADVADVRPFLYRCGALAVPLRIGGGSRLKILEALACNLPVVASTVGAEGLHLLPGVHFARADQTADMARILIEWMRNPAPARAMARAGRTVVEARYDWGVLARKMERAWEELAAYPHAGAPQRSACAK